MNGILKHPSATSSEDAAERVSGKNSASKLPRQVVQIGREICGELGLIEEREFLVTNGKGGYSSMTAACSLTRSYHGLLIAALRPPLDRTLLLSKLNETVTYLGRTYYLYADRRSAASRFKTPRGPNSKSSPARDKFNSIPKKYLSTGDVVSPLGYLHLDSVRLEGTVPVFTYAFADALLEKRIWMKQGQNTIFVTYYLRRGSDVVELDLAAWVNHRDHHHRTQPNSPRFDHSAVIVDESTVRVDYDLKSTKTQLFMRVERGTARLTNSWMSELYLDKERNRGLPHIDAALHAASFNVDLVPGSRVTFVATSETGDDENTAVSTNGDVELQLQHHHSAKLLDAYDMARSKAQQRRRNIAKQLHRSVPVVEQWPRSTRRRSGGFSGTMRRNNLAPPEADLADAVRQLVLAADQFIIERGNGDSVVAGWHWFTDWARDTMISLPGLSIATGRFEVARSILVTFAGYVSKGMLPNRFPDDGTAPQDEDYNNCDGTLWYFESIRAYYAASDDISILLELYSVLEDIVQRHVEGTRFGIKQDDDGLLWAGVENLALTWMDAKCEKVVTPRRGKPVEVQALWFNALHTMAFFSRVLKLSERAEHYTRMADRTERSFRRKFWCPHRQYCYDVLLNDEEGDITLRPNQLIAASLNWSPLNAEQRRSVVEIVSVHLLTSHGIRTLPENSSEYHGTYEGGVNQRDGAYHQGTSWGWLLGPFVMAHLRVFGDKEKARDYLRPLLKSHLNNAGLGQISEIFDADPPFRSRGCIAQAWSVAEVLRAWAATEPDDHGEE